MANGVATSLFQNHHRVLQYRERPLCTFVIWSFILFICMRAHGGWRRIELKKVELTCPVWVRTSRHFCLSVLWTVRDGMSPVSAQVSFSSNIMILASSSFPSSINSSSFSLSVGSFWFEAPVRGCPVLQTVASAFRGFSIIFVPIFNVSRLERFNSLRAYLRPWQSPRGTITDQQNFSLGVSLLNGKCPYRTRTVLQRIP